MSAERINVMYVVQTEDAVGLETENSKCFDDVEHSEMKKAFRCQFCPSEFDRALSLYGHLNTHKNEVFPCTYTGCKQVFTSLKSFRKHISEHDGTSHPFECKLCGLRFDRKSQLGYHIQRNHEKVINYTCEICKKGFYKSSDYRTHLNSHSNVKKYACEECGKGFSHVSNLNRHKRVHTNEKPYVCQDCGKRFNQTSTLNNHAKIHSAHIFGQCPECPKKFKTGRVLLKHLRISHLYSSENLKMVASNSILFSHKKYMKLLTGPGSKETFSKSFYCEVCGQQFSFKHQLRLHMVKDHEKQDNLHCKSCKQNFKSCEQLLGHSCKCTNEVEKADVVENYHGDESANIVFQLNGEEMSLEDENLKYAFISEDTGVAKTSPDDAENVENIIGNHVIIDANHGTTDPENSYVDYFQQHQTVECPQNVDVQEIIKNYITPTGDDTQIVIVQQCDNNYWEDPNVDTTTIEFILDDDVVKNLDAKDFNAKIANLDSGGNGIEVSQSVHQKHFFAENVQSEKSQNQEIGKEPPYRCTECGKIFSKKCNLKNHMGLHATSERKYKCQDCQETFAWKSSLNRHRERTHEGGDKVEYSCNWCDKRYKVISILNDHVKRDHFHERKHKCDLCDKAFFKVNDLKYHKRVHLSIKPYVCSDCGKRFSHVSHYHRHKRIHTGVKPYTCNICNKNFNQSNAMKSHRKTHFRESGASSEI